MAASKERIVSSGRSKRGRVGFDQSGSAESAQGELVSSIAVDRRRGMCQGRERTDRIAILILMFHCPERAQIGLFQSNRHYGRCQSMVIRVIMRPRGSGAHVGTRERKDKRGARNCERTGLQLVHRDRRICLGM